MQNRQIISYYAKEKSFISCLNYYNVTNSNFKLLLPSSINSKRKRKMKTAMILMHDRSFLGQSTTTCLPCI